MKVGYTAAFLLGAIFVSVSSFAKANGKTSPSAVSSLDPQTRDLIEFCHIKRYGLDDTDQMVAKLTKEHFNVAYRAKDGSTLLHLAIHTNREELVTHLIDEGVPINTQRKDGSTALHLAIDADLDKTEIIRSLLRHGADPNIQDKDGTTPLLLAVSKHLDESIDLLLENSKTNVNLVDRDGVTPLILAAQMGDAASVLKLLRRGAKKDARDKKKFNALDYAKFGSYDGMVETLEEWK
jgi:hypothetical protein